MDGVTRNKAAMLLTELQLTLHYQEANDPIFITYMDASKAFDVMDHDAALIPLPSGVTESSGSAIATYTPTSNL